MFVYRSLWVRDVMRGPVGRRQLAASSTLQIWPVASPSIRVSSDRADRSGVISWPPSCIAVNRSIKAPPICSRGWLRIQVCIAVSTAPGR